MSDDSEARLRRLRSQVGVVGKDDDTGITGARDKGPPTRQGRPATSPGKPSLPPPRRALAEREEDELEDPPEISVTGLIEIPTSPPPPPADEPETIRIEKMSPESLAIEPVKTGPHRPSAETQTGKSRAGKTETGKTETGKAEIGKAETGKAETGTKAGKTEPGPEPAPPPRAPRPRHVNERTVKSPPPDFAEESSELFLDDEDFLELQTAPGAANKASDAAADIERAAAAVNVETDESLWEAGRRFYLAEAAAAAEHQPERGALMWIEAARLAERSNAPAERVLSHLDAALELCKDGPLLPAIRRAVMRLANHERALSLARTEIGLGGSPGRRAAVMIEAAALLRHVEDKPAEALELLEEAAALQPGSVPALAMAAGLLAELRRPRRLAVVLGQLVEALSAPAERALFLYRIGSLHEHVLDDLEQAEVAYGRALEADPEHLPAVMALCGVHERRGRWEELTRRLEHWAELTRDETTEARLLMRAGAINLEVNGDLEAAARCFNGAARAAPDDRAARQRLSEIHAATARAEALVTVLRQMIGQTLDGEGRAALACRIGWQLHNRLGDLEGAVAAYRAAIDESPAYLPAVQALGTIYRQLGDFERLVEVDLAEGELTDAPAARAARYLDAAEILAERLGRADEAIDACRRALDLEPGSALAFGQLSRLLEREGRHGELASLLAARIEATSDEKTRHHLRRQLATLQAGPLQAPDKAIETLGRAREADRTRGASLVLMRLLEREERFAELVQLLLGEADDTKDTSEAQALRLRAARLLDETLDEPDRALEVYEGLLAGDARCAPAMRAAGRIYHRLGRWKELIELHRRELGGDQRDAAGVHCRIARLYEEELGDRERAITAYRAALAADGGYTPALAALERLLRSNERWPELLEVLLRYAEVREEPLARAEALCRAAELAELHLGDLDRAAELYGQAREVGDGYAQASFGLVSVLRRQQRQTELATALGQLGGSLSNGAAAAQIELLRLRVEELSLGKPAELASYERLRAELPQGDRLREELLRLRRAAGGGELAEALERRGAECADPLLAVAYLLEGSLLRELTGVDRAATLELCQQAHHRRPDDPLVLWSLERAVWRLGDRARLAQLYEQEAKLELDPLHKTLRLTAASAAFLGAGLGAEAARTARLALISDSRCLPALRLLAQLAEATEDWAALADVSDQLAAACCDRGNRLEASRRAAQLWAERLGDDTRALSSLKFALANDATDEAAFAAAEAIYRRRGEHAELSLLFEQRIRATTEVEARLGLLRQHADLLYRELNQPTRAIALLKDLLAQRPDDADALGQLAELHALKEHWSDAAAALQSLIERTADDRRYRAQLRLAELYFTRLHEPRRAREVLDQVLAEHPADAKAKQLLVDLAVNGGDWPEARRMLEELAAEEDNRLRVWALSRLADVANIGLRDQELRRRYEAEALTEAAVDRELLDQLAEGYWARRQQLRLLHLGEEIVRETARAEVVVPLRLLVARLLLEEGSDAPRALELLREALLAESSNEEVQLLFAQALEATGDDEAAVEGYRRILEGTVDCVPAHQGLARLFARLGRAEPSAAAASVLEMFGAADAAESVSARTLEDGAPPPGRVVLLERLALAADLRPVTSLLEPALPHLGDVYPLEGQQSNLAPSHPAAVACQRIGSSLGLGAVRAAIGRQAGAVAGLGNPIPLLIDRALVEQHQSARFRLWVGRALCAAGTGQWLLERLDDDELDALLVALTTARPGDRATLQLRKQVSKGLPRRLRKQLEAEATPRTGGGLWARYREAGRQRVDRVGLLVCRSPRVAIGELAQAEGLGGRLNDIPRLAELVRYALSDELAVLARQLWTAPAATG